MKTIKELEEGITQLRALLGAMSKILVEKDIFTSDEFLKTYNYCLSDLDQYESELRDSGESDDECILKRWCVVPLSKEKAWDEWWDKCTEEKDDGEDWGLPEWATRINLHHLIFSSYRTI